jgi:hypothetical protein
MGMKLEFIESVLKTSLYLSIFCFLAVFFMVGLPEASSIFAGGLWGSLNLFVIKQLCENILIGKYKEPIKLLFLFGIKCPVLYAIGFGLLKIKYFDFMYLVLGFSLLIVSILVAGVGNLFRKSSAQDFKTYE